MRQHRYFSTADFHAPFDPIPFQGLGATAVEWPKGRAYFDVSNFRAPYDQGFYQRNALFGLGAVPSSEALPPDFARFLATGAPMPAWKRDLGSAANQVPYWLYGLIGLVGVASAYKMYKQWKKEVG